ncbi:Crp/Fnr family transcriptional regulator [Streptomyces sp. NBC_01498]|uniref:Crp/Fnr family transcriptional regulator n=1 Tax=Streptomyces sp. NBC_01498 TaxID=2975870 RepID=UPI002E7B16FF|nr:Crp/Fnr family transcriptional regulator [Streptomyces sp. NBC_01498]WTL25198.1 Crp/Fnr family transcriptional regulator [Streptomyces sp. NBC_01498]
MVRVPIPGDDGLDDRVPYLARLEATEREALLTLGREMRFAPRAELLREYEPSAHILLVLQGWTKVTAAAANGYVMLLALRGPGDIIGESASLTGRPRSATVTALEAVRAVVIDHDGFQKYLADHPEAMLKLLGLASDRSRAGDRRRLEFASLTVRERLAALLLELARTHGRRIPEGIELAVPLSKMELAGSIGASREMVQRLFKDLREREVIVTGRRTLIILRPDVLRRVGGSG